MSESLFRLWKGDHNFYPRETVDDSSEHQCCKCLNSDQQKKFSVQNNVPGFFLKL
jgi:hypothetical protein